MYVCACGHTAETEGGLMSHFIERHCLSYDIELCCPLGFARCLTGGFGALAVDDRQLPVAGY
jgi:hypothetical protein